MAIKLIVDSSADLPKSIIDQYDIKISPLSIHFDEEEYLDYSEISSKAFFEKLVSTEVVPTTSQVPPERFIELMKPILAQGDSVIVITIGSSASGTCQSAHIAVDELETDQVTIIDSNGLSGGTGYIAIQVAKMIEQGLSRAEILENVKPLTKNRIEQLFCVDTLEYLKKGGRIKPGKAAIAEILNIKPILNVEDAVTQTISKVRGRKKIIPYFVKKIACEIDPNSDFIIVNHGNDLPFAEKLVKAIKEELCWDKEIIMGEVGATIGTHSGPGILAVFYLKN